MELVERYLRVVVSHFPKQQQQATAEKLLSEIETKIQADHSGLNETDKVKKVLENLGDPKKLAVDYGAPQRYLIGPKYFDAYLLVLKIVTLAIILGLTIANLLAVLISSDPVWEVIPSYLGGIFQAVIQGAAWVTGIFALLEYRQVDFGAEKPWQISELPAVAHKKLRISRIESIIAIILSMIFFSFLYFAPQITFVMNALNSETVTVIQLFNQPVFETTKWLLLISFIFALLQESLKVIWGQWTHKNVVINALVLLASTVFVLVFINLPDVWNPEIGQAIVQYTDFDATLLPRGLTLFIGIITVLEIATSFYKVYRYREKNEYLD